MSRVAPSDGNYFYNLESLWSMKLVLSINLSVNRSDRLFVTGNTLKKKTSTKKYWSPKILLVFTLIFICLTFINHFFRLWRQWRTISRWWHQSTTTINFIPTTQSPSLGWSCFLFFYFNLESRIINSISLFPEWIIEFEFSSKSILTTHEKKFI